MLLGPQIDGIEYKVARALKPFDWTELPSYDYKFELK